MKIIKTYESYNLNDLDLGRFSEKIDKRFLTQNSDGTYDYNSFLNFNYMDLKSLTEIPIKFRKVDGNFDCFSNQLTSLEGAPLEVMGGFWCSLNKLTSLQGAPSTVGGPFMCNLLDS